VLAWVRWTLTGGRDGRFGRAAKSCQMRHERLVPWIATRTSDMTKNLDADDAKPRYAVARAVALRTVRSQVRTRHST
jgi:hypothetical protein